MLRVEVDMQKRIVLFAVLAAACGEESVPAELDSEFDSGVDAARAAPPPEQLQFWATCGDPVCSGWVDKGLPRCNWRETGDPCRPAFEGKECDPHDPCNVTLLCSATDPIGPEGCPL